MADTLQLDLTLQCNSFTQFVYKKHTFKTNMRVKVNFKKKINGDI